MSLRLQKFQDEDEQAWKLRAEQSGKDNWKDIKGALHYQNLLYILEIIRIELISKHHVDPLVGHFSIEKTQELVAQKYY